MGLKELIDSWKRSMSNSTNFKIWSEQPALELCDRDALEKREILVFDEAFVSKQETKMIL